MTSLPITVRCKVTSTKILYLDLSFTVLTTLVDGSHLPQTRSPTLDMICSFTQPHVGLSKNLVLRCSGYILQIKCMIIKNTLTQITLRTLLTLLKTIHFNLS